MQTQAIINRYSQDKAQASQVATQVLEEINNLELPSNPIHFFLIYEWLTKLDQFFFEEIDQAIKLKSYDNDTANTLFNEFISILTSQQLPANNFNELLSQLLSEISIGLDKTEQNQKNIQSYVDNLKSEFKNQPDTLKIIDILEQQILPEISAFQTQNKALQSFVKETSSKVEILQHEIEQITHISVTDELTGIPNRRGFNQAMPKIIQKALETSASFSLCIIDIDFFKNINDTFGHLVGDSILRFLAKFLTRQIKGMDMVARIGGEEFILILPDTYYSAALKVAQNICLKIAQQKLQIVKQNKPLILNVSIGVAAYQLGESLENLIDRADKALYLAKNTGRNKVCGETDL